MTGHMDQTDRKLAGWVGYVDPTYEWKNGWVSGGWMNR